MKPIQHVLIYSLLISGLFSCNHKTLPQSSLKNYHFKSANGLPDYSMLDYWAAHPWKWDPSDSISKAIKKETIDTLADVFFIYPTSLVDYENIEWNAQVDDSIINQKTDYNSILYQASVFNGSCRIFSPRYRQAHLKSFYSADTTRARIAFDTAYQDVRNAFLYYLNNWQKGRPIIIAAHSQGSVHAKRLLKEFFDGKDLQNKLVCAYVLGMPVEQNYFQHLSPCKNSQSTGCIISWRTFKRGYTDTLFVAKEQYKAIVTNPLTWSLDNGIANSSLNTGGILTKFNKLVPKVVDAEIHENVLWTSKPKFFGNVFFNATNYHVGDYNLFYMNIRQNVKARIASFLLK